MTHLMSPKTRFVTMTSVAALMAVAMSGTSAQAACTKAAKIVTCSGASTSYFDAAADITVNVDVGAQVDAAVAGDAGIELAGINATINNYFSINGAPGKNGVLVRQGGTIANFTGALIRGGTGAAVLAEGGPLDMLNAGTIEGGMGDGIVSNTGLYDSKIINSGKIASGINKTGIVLSSFDNATVINTNGAEISGDIGIDVRGTTGTAYITNNGVLRGTKLAIKGGDAQKFITNNGSIIGSLSLGKGFDSVSNFGRIDGALDLGDGDNFLTNDKAGVITQDVTGFGGSDVVANVGRIEGKLDLGAGGNIVVNGEAGVIVKGIKGLGGDDVIRNSGVIGTAMTSIEIDLGDGKNYLNNSATGNIFGKVTSGAGDDQIENAGTITGSADMGDGDDTVTNDGLVTGNINLGGATNKNTLTNNGKGVNGGIRGNVTGGAGVDEVTNNGDIGGSLSLGNGKNIITNNVGASLGGITTGNDDDTVTNSGVIGGNIDLGDGNDKLTLNMGMSVGGTIDGGNGNDSLILSNKGVQVRETLSNTIVNFDNLVVDSNIGDVWVLNNNYTFGTKVDITTGVVEIAKMMTLESATVTLDGVVASGRARLQGEGTIKGDLVVTKGIVTAGNAPTGIGTLSVTGDYTNSADGYLDVSVGPGSDQTKLAVTRNVTLGGTLRVSVAAGFYKNGASYDVITFGGTRTGQFATANLPTASKFTKFKVNYAPKAVQVQVEKLNYNTVGNTYNQRQAGDGLFRGMAGSGAGSDMETVAKAFEGLGANDDAYRAALDSLSGEGWAAMGEVRGSVTRNFRALGMGRIDGNSEGVGVWGNVLQGQEDVKGDGNGERIRGDVRGLVGGVEYGFGGGKVGIMVGYGQGELKLHSRGEGEVKLMMGGVYGGWNLGGIEVSGGVSYASGKQKVERHISVGGTVQRDVRGSEQVREFGMDVGVGYGINLGMIKVTPQVGLEMARVYEQGFEEKGGDAVSLSGEKEKGWEGRGHVSMEVSAVFQVGLVSFEPYVKGGYERVLVGKGYQDRDVSFQQPGTAFNVRSTDGSKNIYTGGGGLNVGFGPVTLGVGYQQSIGGKRDERTFQGSLGIRW